MLGVGLWDEDTREETLNRNIRMVRQVPEEQAGDVTMAGVDTEESDP